MKMWDKDMTTAERARLVRSTLRETDGNRTHAAKKLGVRRGTLLMWISKHRTLIGIKLCSECGHPVNAKKVA
jgi:transcriptional regulator with PAS, ATPase and Fis domain